MNEEPSSLVIRMFGPLDVRVGGAPLPRLRSLKGQWLLALLVLRHGAEVERSWLAGLLWPDSAEAQALANLRNSLTDLRRALGPAAERLLSPTPHTLSLDLSGVDADVVAFDAAIEHLGAAEPGEAVRAALERAVALYRGPLLEGCGEEWAFQERHAREQAYLAAQERLAAQRGSSRFKVQGSKLEPPATLSIEPSILEPAAPAAQDTLTFLFADIEDGGAEGVGPVPGARRWEEQPDVMRLAIARHETFLRDAIETNHGRVFKTAGDLLCAAFATAAHAVDAALVAQRRLHALDPSAIADVADLSKRVRMVLHTGAAELRDGDYFGPALNRVARLLAEARGGQILLSGVTQELVQDDLPRGASLRDLGSHRLRDLQRPEQVFQLLHPDLPADFPPLQSLNTLPNNLPEQATRFIGREKEIAALKRLLGVVEGVQVFGCSGVQVPTPVLPEHLNTRTPEHPVPSPDRPSTRLVTITGAGGTGKTRLALQVAAELLEHYRDGVWMVELAALLDPALVPQALATALAIREERDRPLTSALVETLKSRQLLILLDNCEHLLAACAELAEALLRGCPEVCILATSREGLNIPGEATYRLPSLPVPDPHQWSRAEGQGSRADGSSLGTLDPRPSALDPQPSTLLEFESVRLFVDRAMAAVPSFALTEKNALAVARICFRLDGIPLAIELAAARVKVLPVEAIYARLDDRFRLLVRGDRAALPRQQTLRASIDWSHALLSEPERVLLRRLAVFSGGWTLEAAEAVCSSGGYRVQGSGVSEASASFLTPDPCTLYPSDVLDLLTALVEKSLVIYEEPRIGEARYRMLETIRDYARERLREAGEEEALRERHRDWFLDLTEQASPELSGTRQRAWLDRVEEEHDNLRSALEWSEATDIEAGLRMAGALATFWWARGYPAEGRARLASLLAHPEARAPAAARIRALQGAGLLADRQSDYPAAHAHFQESLALCRKLGDWRRAATALQCLGLTAAAWESDYTAARAYYEQALAIRRELRDHSGVAHTLELIGNLERLEGRYARARALYEQSLDLFRDLGNHAGIAVMLDQLGNLAWHGGEHARARDLLEESLAIRRETGNKGGIALSLFSLGEVALSVGDDAGAQALFEESRSLQEALGGRRAVANVLHRLGELHLRRQEYDRAGELLTGSLRLHRGLGNRYGILTALESLAALALALGQADRAARLWGASAALREELRLPMLPHDRVHYERRVAAARAEMGEAAFTAGWEAGRAMAMQEAFEMAVQRVNVAPTTGT